MAEQAQSVKIMIVRTVFQLDGSTVQNSESNRPASVQLKLTTEFSYRSQ